MKNYSLNYNDSKAFILNYKIEDNKIIINLASGEKYVIPYSLENEKKLLTQMKKQILNSSKFEKKQEKRFSFAWKWGVFSSSMLIIFSIMLATGITVNPIATIIGGSWMIIDIASRIYAMIDSKRKIEDIHKNKMFLSNQESINQKIKSNQNILSNTNKKTKEIVSSASKNKPTFNLNVIDKIKYKELKKILENIKRDKQFGFDYSPAQEEKKMNLKK